MSKKPSRMEQLGNLLTAMAAELAKNGGNK